MSSTRRQYPFHLIEPKWQRHWEDEATFRAWSPGDPLPVSHPFVQRHGLQGQTATPANLPPKFYILDMFPYPSGAGLHVGHPEGYTATDILARYRRAAGFNVLHPIGWDAFGLPAEQYAIKFGQHPRVTTETNIATFRRQIKSLGFSYDWRREIDTTDPRYFRWTQWIFLQLYHAWFNPDTGRAEPIATLPYPGELKAEPERRAYRDGRRLAYVSDAPVWWCEALGTVLANEEVIDGKSEVGNFPVVRRPMRQWVLRITAYAERLLCDLETIDWSDSLKEMQRNWIGRSEGADVAFTLDGSSRSPAGSSLTVFTTRPDTLFGATYMVLAPEHPWVNAIIPRAWPTDTPMKWKGQLPEAVENPRTAIDAYRAYAAAKSDRERTDQSREKTGVFTGVHAVNPANGERIPIWIADYVLLSYGTGAIMAVPAHDSRDLEFARAFDLPVRVVVEAPAGVESIGFVGEGMSINSGFISGLPTAEAKAKIIDWLVHKGLGQSRVNYKLRDWLFSRQRYWGEPFPIVWKTDLAGNTCHEALPESALPILPPPLDDYKPTADGRPPLARAKEWVELEGAQRETNTMPQWAGSCWYYLRYLDPANHHAFCGPDPEHYWMGTVDHSDSKQKPGVDLYVGGTEHAVLHLLYARFWHKVLFDLGHVSTPEPFYKLVNQGLILGEDGQKMSKSRGNVINPDDILKEYGADAFRLYEMFLGPLEMAKPWNTRGVEGVYRFLGRVWRLFIDEASEIEFEQRCAADPLHAAQHLESVRRHPAILDRTPDKSQLRALHACIRKVTEDLDHLRFNTAISALMVFVNEAITWETRPLEILGPFLVLLHPFAPHLAEELAQLLDSPQGTNANGSARPAPRTIAYTPWPGFDPQLLVEDTLEIPVQINGKLRDRIRISADATPAQIEQAARTAEKIVPLLAGQAVKRIVVVPGKLVNLVVSP